MSYAEGTRYPNGEWTKSPEIQRPRIVVTGIGMVTPLGNDTKTSWENTVAGNHGFSVFDMREVALKAGQPELVGMPHEVTVAGVSYLRHKQLEDLLVPNVVSKKDWKDFSYSAGLTTLTALEALKHAGLFDESGISSVIDSTRFGSIYGTMIGGMGHFGELYMAAREKGLSKKGQIKPSDTFVAAPERVATAPSMAFGAQGPTYEVSAACASGSIAIIAAADSITLGKADVMLAGGVDAPLDPVELEMFSTLHALTQEQNPSLASRPFDKAHGGFVMAEGACTLILESEEHAKKRGANILAYLSGYREASDAYHKSSPSGHAARVTIRETLKAAGIPNPDQGGIYNNAHGTGTPTGDGVELTAIKDVINELPYKVDFRVSSSKSMIGHTMGASGAIEAAIAVMAVRNDIAPPTINLENPIPEGEGMNLVPNEAQEMKIALALSGNFGFGGPGTTIGFSKE